MMNPKATICPSQLTGQSNHGVLANISMASFLKEKDYHGNGRAAFLSYSYQYERLGVSFARAHSLGRTTHVDEGTIQQ